MDSSEVDNHTGMTSPDTPPPSPPNEHQTEAKIEYTDASTIKVSKDRPPKRRPASSDLDSNTDPLSVPSVEVREPTADVITKPPCKQHLSHDEIELESWNWDRISCGTGNLMWEREWEFYIPQEEKRFFKKRTIVSAFDDVLDGQVHDPEQRSTAGSDAHSAGTVSAKSTHRLIGKKFEEDEPDGMWCNFMIGCCTCLGFFCFT